MKAKSKSRLGNSAANAWRAALSAGDRPPAAAAASSEVPDLRDAVEYLPNAVQKFRADRNDLRDVFGIDGVFQVDNERSKRRRG